MIKINEDYRIFTHSPAKESVIPLSHSICRAYPTRIEIVSEEKSVVIDCLDISDVEDFTHMLNIEKKRVEVFIRYNKAYVHFFFYAKEGKVYMQLHRGSKLRVLIDGKEQTIEKKECVELLQTKTMKCPESMEKLTFGCSKKPGLEKLKEKQSKLFVLSNLIPQKCGEKVTQKVIDTLLVDMFSPKSIDQKYTGVAITAVEPFSLFSSFNTSMREKLFSEEEDTLIFMPKIKELNHCGRILSYETKDVQFDLLWKKNKVLRCIIYPKVDCTKRLLFSKSVKTFRVKNTLREKGERRKANESVSFTSGKKYIIDRIIY